jgi:hypothetical protein
LVFESVHKKSDENRDILAPLHNLIELVQDAPRNYELVHGLFEQMQTKI